jgi:Zn finger protein HypA/HybF involved in hydrogenase expression
VTEQPHPIPAAILDQAGRVALDLACRKCGRNLRAMLPEEACPECGRSVAHSLSETLDDQACVHADIACLKCAYNLRSLRIDGKCPECGSPVADSIRGDLLQFADPSWVKGLATGATLLLAAGIGTGIAVTCGFLGSHLFVFDRAGVGTAIGAVALAVACIGAIAAPFLLLGGLVKLTASEPRISFRPEGLSPRRACHYSLVAVIPLVGFCVIMVALERRISPPWAGVSMLMATLIVLFGALPVSLLRHLAALFRRVPDTGHAATARGLSVVILVGDAIIAIPLVTSLFIARVGTLPGIASIGALILAGCGLGLLGVLYYARADFAKAAEQTKLHAASDSGDRARDDSRDG